MGTCDWGYVTFKTWLSFFPFPYFAQVFNNFQRVHQYQERFNDLKDKLNVKLRSQGSSTDGQVFDVFLSYAWVNSDLAVQKGHARAKEGAVGKGDPRLIKEYLQKQGLSVWLDIEQVGRVSSWELIRVLSLFNFLFLNVQE